MFERLVFNPLRRIGFDPRSVHVRFGVEEVALELVFLRMHRFSPVTVIPPTLRTYFMRVALAKDKGAEPGNLPITSALSKIGELSIEKYFHLRLKVLVSVSAVCKRNTLHSKTNQTLLVS